MQESTSFYKEKIILLDLNFTLVVNSAGEYPFTKKIIEAERYRQWLVEALKDNTVIIITVRNVQWKILTLEMIHKHTNWQPTDVYFPLGFEHGGAPPTKEKGLNDYILPKYGTDVSKYLALESNPKTTLMYSKLGIKAMTQSQFKKELENPTKTEKVTEFYDKS